MNQTEILARMHADLETAGIKPDRYLGEPGRPDTPEPTGVDALGPTTWFDSRIDLKPGQKASLLFQSPVLQPGSYRVEASANFVPIGTGSLYCHGYRYLKLHHHLQAIAESNSDSMIVLNCVVPRIDLRFPNGLRVEVHQDSSKLMIVECRVCFQRHL